MPEEAFRAARDEPGLRVELSPAQYDSRALDADADLGFHPVLIGLATEQLAPRIFALQRALAQGLTLAQFGHLEQRHPTQPPKSLLNL